LETRSQPLGTERKNTLAESPLKRLGAILFRTLVIATFALWFGGFTFYVAFVVPIGNDVLGSARTQGFITQQVTNWLNVVCGFAIGLMILETIRGRIVLSIRGRWTEIAMLVLMIGSLIVLIWLHPIMDEMIDVADESITDETRFYGLHRIYLWVSTFQWIVAWVWLFLTVRRWQEESERNRRVS
jgi:magnesium-transporting ATPase (P-type)